MKNCDFYPLKLRPVTRSPVWSGTRLAREWNITSKDGRAGEAWMLSSRRGEANEITNGRFAGIGLDALFGEYPEFISGNNGEFPLLVKLIDAEMPLSVQVHPDDAYARRVGDGSGKTEVWHILDCEKGAYIINGLRRDVTKEDLVRLIADGRAEEAFERTEAVIGSDFFIPSGHVHAIGGGILLCEIQQNSDATYRLYDYGRLEKNGRPRPLQLEKALDVMRYYSSETIASLRFSEGSPGEGEVASCIYFSAQIIEARDGETLFTEGKMIHLLPLGDGLDLSYGSETLSVTRGESVLVPACMDGVRVFSRGQALISRPGSTLKET